MVIKKWPFAALLLLITFNFSVEYEHRGNNCFCLSSPPQNLLSSPPLKVLDKVTYLLINVSKTHNKAMPHRPTNAIHRAARKECCNYKACLIVLLQFLFTGNVKGLTSCFLFMMYFYLFILSNINKLCVMLYASTFETSSHIDRTILCNSKFFFLYNNPVTSKFYFYRAKLFQRKKTQLIRLRVKTVRQLHAFTLKEQSFGRTKRIHQLLFIAPFQFDKKP